MTTDDIRRRYSSGVSNSPDTTGIFVGVVTKVVAEPNEVYVRVPRLTGVYENKARTTIADISEGDQVFVSLLEGRRDDFVIVGKAQLDTPTHEPTGFADKAQSVISFDRATRTFTIAPASGYDSFDVWCKGVKYVKTTAESVVTPNTSGVHYIYYEAGVLTTKTTFFDLENEAPVSYIYWNAPDATEYYFADERHGFAMDWATHEYLHRTRGAAFATGFVLGNYTTTGTGNTNSDAQVSLANGTFFDEDLQIDVVNSATPTANTWEQRLSTTLYAPVFYATGSQVWKKDTATAYPLKFGTLAQYNLNSAGTWSAANVSSNKFCIYWLVATANLNEPVLSIMGQGEYNTIGDAEAVGWSNMDLTGLPIVEFRTLYKLIFQTASGYSNAVKSRLVSATDVRVTGYMVSGQPSAPSIDHGSLTGLTDDDHTQYILATGSRAFSGQITSTVATGTAPLSVASTTAVTNLNSDLLDGQHGSYYNDAANLTGTVASARLSGAYTGITGVGTLASGLTVTGTVSATTFSGSGSSLTSVPASQLTGTALPSGIVSSSLTSVGTLSSLVVTGNLTVDTNTLAVDSTNNRVGVNTASPATALDVIGTATVRTAATQDGVALAGRAGGTSTYEVTLTPTTLTADRILTLPDVAGTVITTGNLSSITSTGTLSSLTVTGTLKFGGKIIQSGTTSLTWNGSVARALASTVTFSTAFTATPVIVALPTEIGTSTDVGVDIRSVSTTSASFVVFTNLNTNPANGTVTTVHWIAIGDG